MKAKKSKLTVLRLLASGALLGLVVASILGVDVSLTSHAGVLSGAVGAAGSALLLKLVHII